MSALLIIPITFPNCSVVGEMHSEARRETVRYLGVHTIPREALPAWMHSEPRRLDPCLLIVLAFGLLAALPLMTRPGLPANTDAALYEYRSAQVAALAKGGVLFPRWLPEAYFGYGSPLLNYLPPLPHVLPALHQALTEATPTESVKAFLVMGMLAAGVGMYLFCRGRFGAGGGLIGALAYQFAPPLLSALPYHSGDLALVMAMAALPFAVWGLDAIRLTPGREAFFAALLALTAFALTDARIVAFATPVLLALLITGRHLHSGRQRIGWQTVLALQGAAILGAICLTAFFWLPAVAETEAIHWLPSGDSTYGGSISLPEIFRSPLPSDPRLLTPLFPRGIGWGAPILALLAFAGVVLQQRRGEGGDVLLCAILGIVFVIFALPSFGGLWRGEGFQAPQPYHAVLVALFCFAVASAGVGRWLKGRPLRWEILGVIGLCGISLLSSLGVVTPPPWNSDLGAENPLSLSLKAATAELRGDQFGTLREGVLLPIQTPRPLDPLPDYLATLREGRLERLNVAGIGAETQLGGVPSGALSYEYILNTQVETTAELRVLFFPGWSAALDGIALSLRPSAEGLISLRLPAVNGALTIRFGGTPARDWGWLITFLGGGVILFLTRRRWAGIGNERREWRGSQPSLGVVVGGGLLLCVFAGGVTLIRALPAATGVERYTPLPRFFQGGVDLLGYRLETATPLRGEPLTLDVYWVASRPLAELLQSEVWLRRPGEDQPYAQSIHRHPGGVASLRWSVGGVVRDRFWVHLPPDTPAGEYYLYVRIGACESRTILPCADMSGRDGFSPTGQSERGGIVIPVVVRIKQ